MARFNSSARASFFCVEKVVTVIIALNKKGRSRRTSHTDTNGPMLMKGKHGSIRLRKKLKEASASTGVTSVRAGEAGFGDCDAVGCKSVDGDGPPLELGLVLIDCVEAPLELEPAVGSDTPPPLNSLCKSVDGLDAPLAA